jgi:acyl transferase domain-containing protein
MDPQQRVLLHVAYEALENAGYVQDDTSSYQRDTFGCYVGVATDDYVANLKEEVDIYHSTGMSAISGSPPLTHSRCDPIGTLRSFLSGRISYAMQWSGPSVVVDTACSSSLVAIYQACRALRNRDCRAALAGGVNIIAGPDVSSFTQPNSMFTRRSDVRRTRPWSLSQPYWPMQTIRRFCGWLFSLRRVRHVRIEASL